MAERERPTLNRLHAALQEYHRELSQVVAGVDLEAVARVGQLVIDAYDRDATIFVFGNGGSGSTASHMASDLSKSPSREGRRRPRVVSLNENIALMTAWSNDDAFTSVFAEQVRSLVRPGDLVIAISASGKPANILEAALRARECGAFVAAFVGFDGGGLAKICDEAVHVASYDYGWVESVHLCVEHYLTYLLRAHIAEADGTGMSDG